MPAAWQDLIERMSRVEPLQDSANSIAWAAYREAEVLDEAAIVAEIVVFLSTKRPTAQRQAAYFILGKVGRNTPSAPCAQVLTDFIDAEHHCDALAALLEALSEVRIADHINLAPVYRLLADPRWRVRHSAIRALQHAESGDAETHVLAHLAATQDPNDVVYCHATLNRIGTLRAIAPLEQGLKSRKRDVKISAEQALKAIRQRCQAG